MTIRNFDALFDPKAIALIGASNRPNSVGSVLARNLTEAGFAGPILMVNPHERTIRSRPNYRSLADLPTVPDLAVVATPPAAVPGLIAELGALGCRAAVVVTAGFGEGGHAEGAQLQQAMLEASRPHLLRIVGPNCLGIMSPGRGINASFAHLNPAPGDLAFVTQSGALATAVLDWASARGIGFSHVVSVGDMADVDFGDLLDYLALDTATRAMLLYVESISHARKFISAARIASRSKPVVVIKSGRSSAGAKAALSHTGALAGSDFIYDAVFRRAGMLRVNELRELFEAVTTLSAPLEAHGDRLIVITNGGGAGVLAADALEARGGQLAKLSDQTLAALDAVLPRSWSRGNPVDILGDASGDRYSAALTALRPAPGRDAILIINCPTAVADSTDAASAVIAARGGEELPLLTCWLGEPAAAAARKLFAAARIPTFETPDDAVRAFTQLVDYRRNQDLLLEAPPAGWASRSPDRQAVHAIVDRALDERRRVLTEPEAKAVLEAYKIPTAAAAIATDAGKAAELAFVINGPVVLKILSPDITHKSDVGGVRLDLETPEEVEAAAHAMLAAVRGRVPNARITGFVVEQMVRRPFALELLVGIAEDPVFGPVILFGQGGTAAEVIGDRAIGLPPLNPALATDMLQRTRIARLLDGYRNHPPVNRAAIVATVIQLSQLAIDFPEIAELDINPLLVDVKGAIALDARIVVRSAAGLPADRLSIRPYPSEIDHNVSLDGGVDCTIRAIRPDDAGRVVEMLARTAAEDKRLPFLLGASQAATAIAARLSQIDYDREMALVAIARPTGAGANDMIGIARFKADPDNQAAEFTVMIRSDIKGRGLGFRLMTELVDYARRRGLKRLFGLVPSENLTMLRMARELGFTAEPADGPGFVHVSIEL